MSGIGNNKAPGMDEFNFFFFKSTWKIIKHDVITSIMDFFASINLHLAINCLLVTLIPKSSEATTIKDMRHISCCSIIYKLISKILTARLAKMIDSIIDDNQYAFILGRTIHDNISLAHELVSGYGRKNISPRCMVQIDIQKEYDTVEWPALAQIMVEIGIPQRFTNWIMAYVTFVSYRFSINGVPSGILKAKRGFRHGDPISPLLFVLIMEYFHRIL